MAPESQRNYRQMYKTVDPFEELQNAERAQPGTEARLSLVGTADPSGVSCSSRSRSTV